MSERPSAEQMERIRILNAHILKIGAECTVDQHVTMLLTELDAVTRERDANDQVINKLSHRVADLERERDEAQKANHVVAIPEPLAADVLDEIEAAIGAGRAMGHGAWAILNRAWRLLQPSFRADQSRLKEYS